MTPRPAWFFLYQERYPKIGCDILQRKHMVSKSGSNVGRFLQSGGDPINVDPSVATFDWNTSRMSDRAAYDPISDTDFSLTFCWL